jgi:hypothetical protein
VSSAPPPFVSIENVARVLETSAIVPADPSMFPRTFRRRPLKDGCDVTESDGRGRGRPGSLRILSSVLGCNDEDKISPSSHPPAPPNARTIPSRQPPEAGNDVADDPRVVAEAPEKSGEAVDPMGLASRGDDDDDDDEGGGGVRLVAEEGRMVMDWANAAIRPPLPPPPPLEPVPTPIPPAPPRAKRWPRSKMDWPADRRIVPPAPPPPPRNPSSPAVAFAEIRACRPSEMSPAAINATAPPPSPPAPNGSRE